MRNVTEKLLTYALGRGVEYQDMPLVRKIVRDSAPTNYRFSSLVMSIVTSEPFQMNMKIDGGRSHSARPGNLRRGTICLFQRSTFPGGPFCAVPA